MKLLCVYKSVDVIDGSVLIDAIVAGTSVPLITLAHKLEESNELLDIKFETTIMRTGIVTSQAQKEICFNYSHLAIFTFRVATKDLSQTLNDIASNIQHLIE